MTIPLDPALAELVTNGHAARSLLAALETFCGALVEETLRVADSRIANGTMTAETALALSHEVAAYRRIVARLRQRVTQGERAERRMAAGHEEAP
jgi:hypothetical protein